MWLLKECADWQMDRIAHNAMQRDTEVGHRKEGLRPGDGKAGTAHTWLAL